MIPRKINLTKEMKELYIENKTQIKESEEDTSRWKNIPYSWIMRINTVKMLPILPKAIHRFSSIPIKIPMVHFTELEQVILKFIWNHKRPFKVIQRYSNKNSIVLVPKKDTQINGTE